MPTFDTPAPVALHVRLGSGDVTVTASDSTTSSVDLAPRDPAARAVVERATVDLDGDDLVVDVSRDQAHDSAQVDVTVTVPAGSDVHVSTGSADVTLTGRLGTVQVTTGSGDVQVDDAGGPVSLRTGSGHLTVHRATAEAELKSGSGDLRVDDARADVVLKSGSGNLTVRRVGASRVQATTASGDVQVAVAGDLPAWLDLSTVTGSISSDLDPGEPAQGEPYAEVHATTVSGDALVTRARA